MVASYTWKLLFTAGGFLSTRLDGRAEINKRIAPVTSVKVLANNNRFNLGRYK